MVYRVFVEKKPQFAAEARSLLSEINEILQINSLKRLRIINRYDVEGTDEKTFAYAERNIFSEPQLDDVARKADTSGADVVFAVEPLPGQFDQRADSAAQCIQLISQSEKPAVRTAKVYLLYGALTPDEVSRIKKHVINAVECREAGFDLPKTLREDYFIPTEVETLDGFTALDNSEIAETAQRFGLAMDADDLAFCRDYFAKEKRDPTLTEIRMIDTYWSDHCRHTTFLTTLDGVEFADDACKDAWEDYVAARRELGRENKPVNLMDIATIGAKLLKKRGKLEKLDESDEINACTVKIKAEVDGEKQDWLLLFKNETHNHPTEIEPFGGAATCIGGAIRDPLSGRAYVYSAMRVTGAGNPLKPVSETIKGKLPQRKIVTTAAAGYSSYGNQIGLATGIVDEIYHEGYTAKRMEIGAVVGAAPAANVRRECPAAGDIVILLGGKTGRDGCGGATGSSKAHSSQSLSTCGAEVQKGNAPEERKLQRLFRNPEAALMIKRCNDFGAGGVSVAIGELADGLTIDLDAVLKKYEGLDGTELAISESQERMAVVVAPEDEIAFKALAEAENLEATRVATVESEPRLKMNWNGKTIVDVSREFLNSNGAEKHANAYVKEPINLISKPRGGFIEEMKKLADDLNVCSKRGLSERFDSTIGAGTVLMPFGGKRQLTPIQATANKISSEKSDSATCSMMSWGYNPFVTAADPFRGAYLAVVESVSKLIASGADFMDIYLTFQEFFEKPNDKPERWGKPLAALLGAFKAQTDLGIGAIGGKDSMSGTFENIDVPPTLVSFAVTACDVGRVLSPEFKASGHKVYIASPSYDKNGLPEKHSFIGLLKKVAQATGANKALSVYTIGIGGIAEAIMKMCLGNGLGFVYSQESEINEIFDLSYGSFILEAADELDFGRELGVTTENPEIVFKNDRVNLNEIGRIYEAKLEQVFPCNIGRADIQTPELKFTAGGAASAKYKFAKPKFLIPVFPGTNCEYDTAKAIERAGGSADIFVVNNLTPQKVSESVELFAKKLGNSQAVFIPGGFSAGDEPDGSGKFITAFFRSEAIRDGVRELLKNRDGLMAGICNGFQALIKLGLVTHGDIIDLKPDFPTLTYNVIGRHQSRIVSTKVVSNLSPWLSLAELGGIYSVPVSHGEGRFIASEEWLQRLASNGQIATQYVDDRGYPSAEVSFNPNGSDWAIEGITSPDGRVFGKMGHSERTGNGLYKNVQGNYDIRLFESAVEYYR